MATTDLTPGPAIECGMGCGATTGVSMDDARRSDDCPMCQEPGEAVLLTRCMVGDACDEDTHDFGTGMHHDPLPSRP